MDLLGPPMRIRRRRASDRKCVPTLTAGSRRVRDPRVGPSTCCPTPTCDCHSQPRRAAQTARSHVTGYLAHRPRGIPRRHRQSGVAKTCCGRVGWHGGGLKPPREREGRRTLVKFIQDTTVALQVYLMIVIGPDLILSVGFGGFELGFVPGSGPIPNGGKANSLPILISF